jgi:hypothetical protein
MVRWGGRIYPYGAARQAKIIPKILARPAQYCAGAPSFEQRLMATNEYWRGSQLAQAGGIVCGIRVYAFRCVGIITPAHDPAAAGAGERDT